MFCGQCGRKNDDDKAYCSYCGSPLKPEKIWTDSQETVLRKERDPYSIYSEDIPRPGSFEREMRRGQQRSRNERETLSPVWFFVLFEIILLVVILVMGYVRVKLSVSAPSLAAEYVDAYLDENWGRAYEYLDLNEEDGLKKEDYINANVNKSFGKITNTEVTEMTEDEIPADGMLGADVKYFKVTYFEDGEHKTDRVCLEKTGETVYGFFDEWKVAARDLYGKDVNVVVPSNAEVSLNSKEISEEYRQPTADGADTSVCTYVIPNLFYGDYHVVISQSGFESYKDSKSYSENDSFDYGALKLVPGEELQKKVFNQLVGDWPVLWNAALNRSDFSQIQDYFCSESVADGSAAARYAEIAAQSYTPEAPGYSGIEISNLIAENVSTDRADEICLKVSGKVSKTFTENGQSTVDTYDFSENIFYRLENGTWKLVQFPYV